MVTESDTETKRLMRQVYQKTKESSVSEDCDAKRFRGEAICDPRIKEAIVYDQRRYILT